MWLWSTEDGTFYGFPPDLDLGLKVAHHHSGVLVDPEDVDREVNAADETRIRAFLRTNMPAVDGALRTSSICLYTNAPDDEFVIDRHPVAPGVAFASACSGHGYKFAPVVGEILADLVTTGSTTWPIEAFRADRFRQAST
jgi:sarcosine oxidase